ncbi:MAG: hypothetical protein M3O26_21295 [Pseudomonadota bacterium]|nr:hypothetical protein [Pseudomonadota bacterium]
MHREKSMILASALCALSSNAAAASLSITELKPLATIKLGKTADWVAITADSVWVGSTGPYAVNHIDPKTNLRVASVTLPGEACAGLTAGSGILWVPMCTSPPSLAKVNLKTNTLSATFAVGPAAAEGGIAYGAGSVWMVVNGQGDLARLDPNNGTILDTLHAPPGSYNPLFKDGTVWISHAEGAELTGLDALTGNVIATLVTGPGPRFLAAGAGAIWTLNQGDGTVTRANVRTKDTATIALGTPGHGGDIAFDANRVWTTMPKMPLSLIDADTNTLLCQWSGQGGDSLGIGHGAIWLTDYQRGSVSRISIKSAVANCTDSRHGPKVP